MGNATHILSGAIKVTTDASSVFGANIVKRPVDGAKGTRVSFSTVVSGSTGGGAGGSVSGTRIAKSNLNASQGDIYSTADMPGTFVAVTNGAGRYCVRSINDDTAPIVFTRLGDFEMQADGTLRNSAGQYLCGINYDINGNLPAGGVNIQNLMIMKAPSIASTAIPTATVTVNMKLPAIAATNDTATFDSTLIDSLGITHNATYTLTKQAAANTWNLTGVSLTNGGTLSTGLPIPIVFDNTGAISSIGGAGVAGQPADLPLTFDFSGNGASNAQVVTINGGTFGSASGVTQNGNTPNAVVYSVAQDGAQPSDAIGNEISQDGVLYTRFNGSSKLRARGQVVLAVFGNVNELGDANGTTQVMKVEAGDFTLQIPNKGNGGSLVPNHLEKSTTDATQEYVYLLDNVNQQSILVAGLKHSMEADRALTTL